jgi:hypothetical protein
MGSCRRYRPRPHVRIGSGAVGTISPETHRSGVLAWLGSRAIGPRLEPSPSTPCARLADVSGKLSDARMSPANPSGLQAGDHGFQAEHRAMLAVEANQDHVESERAILA